MRLPKIILYLVSSFPLASATAFLAILLTNQMIFRAWGLNFFQIARPSDILTSVLDVLIRAIPLLLAFIMGNRANYTYDSIVLRTVSAIGWGTLLAIVAFILNYSTVHYQKSFDVGIPSPFAALCPILALFGLLVFRTTTQDDDPDSQLDSSEASQIRMIYPYKELIYWGLPVFIFSLLVVSIEIGQDGYEYRPMALTSDQVDPRCLPHVLWSGSTDMVIRCSSGINKIEVIRSDKSVVTSDPKASR